MANWFSKTFGSKTPKTTMADLFADSAGLAFANQAHLAKLIGEHQWNVSFDTMQLSFVRNDDQRQLVTQANLLGTESPQDGTWLWAWANKASGLPEPAMRLSLELRDFGQREGIRELTEPRLPLESWDAHKVAMVAVGVLDAQAYYCGPFGQGSKLALIIKDPAFRADHTLPVFDFQNAALMTVSNYGGDVPPKRVCIALANRLGLKVQDGTPMTVSGSDGIASLTFDELGRLVNISGALKKPVS